MKKHRNENSTSLKDMKKPMSSWLLLFMVLSVLSGVSFVMVSISDMIKYSDETKKFQAIDATLTKFANAVESSPELNTTVKKEKICIRKYTGFNGWIECGTQIEFHVVTDDISIQKNTIASIIDAAGIKADFSDIEIDYAGNAVGSIEYSIEGALCGGSFSVTKGSNTAGYYLGCSAEASHVLDGYTEI
jgi:hypothetical protein